MELAAGTCENPITTAEQCEVAALQLDLNHTSFNDVSEAPYDISRTGCSLDSSALFFNDGRNNDNTHPCNPTARCVCIEYDATTPQSPAAPAAPPSAPYRYVLQTDGRCEHPITTVEQCWLAALELELGQTEIRDFSRVADAPFRNGCLLGGTTLFFNDGQTYENTDSCNPESVYNPSPFCICIEYGSTAPQSPAAPAAVPISTGDTCELTEEQVSSRCRCEHEWQHGEGGDAPLGVSLTCHD